MAWIKGDKLINIVDGASETETLQRLKVKMDQGWQQASEIKPNGDGYGCLISRDIKVRR